MIKFLADENLHSAIFNGVRRTLPQLDFVRVQDVGLRGEDDEMLLEWCAGKNRIFVTHDLSTIPEFAGDRINAGLIVPGISCVPKTLPFSTAIEDLGLIATCCTNEELSDIILYLPLA